MASKNDTKFDKELDKKIEALKGVIETDPIHAADAMMELARVVKSKKTVTKAYGIYDTYIEPMGNSLKGYHISLMAEIDKSEKAVEELINKLNHLKSIETKWLDTEKKLRSRISQLESSLASKGSQVSASTRDISELKTIVSSKEEKIVALTKKIDELHAAMKELQCRCDQYGNRNPDDIKLLEKKAKAFNLIIEKDKIAAIHREIDQQLEQLLGELNKG